MRPCLSLLLVAAVTRATTANQQSYLLQFQPGSSPEAIAAHLTDTAAFNSLLVPLVGEEGVLTIGESFAAYAFTLRGADDLAADDDAVLDVLAQLRSRPEVAVVERDIALRLKGRLGSGASKVSGSSRTNGSCITQSNVPSWGLARISETKLPLKGTMQYTEGVGADVDLFVLDTGVRTTHVEFGGRAVFAFNAAGGKIDTDHDGHGTFVAGVAAGKTYGVCKSCNVHSVKVFTDTGDCSASILIKAFNWVAAHHSNNTQTKEDKEDREDSEDGNEDGEDATRGTVINISVGGDPGETSDVMDAAVNALVAMGVHVVGAAGNENVDACTESPSRAKGIISVGSTLILTGTTDFFLGGSNFGKCVGLFAPGDKIVSLGIGSDTEVGVVDSGTSFSSPHVAGALARLVSQHRASSLKEVQGILFNSTLKGVIEGVPKGTANKMLHKAC